MSIPVDDTRRTSERDARDNAGVAVTKLIATLTHELKTPLHSILSLTDVLASEIDGSLNSEQKHQVSLIKRNGNLLLDMITELLQYTSMTYRAQFLKREAFDVRALIQEQVETLQTIAVQKRISIESDLESLPTTFVSDSAFVRQIVNNLVSNAIQYSPEESTVSVFARGTGDGALLIDIVDSGSGIAFEDQDEVFESLNRGDQSRDSSANIGLGLAIVKAALEGLGGTLEVKSERGGGTLFRVTLPEEVAADTRGTVLVVESQQAIAQALLSSLEAAGYHCIVRENLSPSSLESEGLSIDVVICDVAVAEDAGRESFKDLPWSEGRAEPHVLLTTPYSAQKLKKKAQELGAHAIIEKPFNIDEVLAAVRKCIAKA